MAGVPEAIATIVRFSTGLAMFVCLFAEASNAQGLPAASVDLAAIVLSPSDEGLNDYLHAGAFDESLIDEARIAAAYRGSPDEEEVYVALLETSGFVRKHVARLQKNSTADAPQIERIVRSYVTSFHTSEGAQIAFAALEDESGALSAEDVQSSRQFGDQTDLTLDGGFDSQSRPFRSLDLTFRIGNLIGGVTLIVYPGASGFEPDQDEVEALGDTLTARLARPPVPSIGVSVARLDPTGTITYDDAYYRLNGVDLPLLDESEDAGQTRREAYGDAQSVYQLFQGIDGVGALGGLYSVTLYGFADDRAAAAWMANSGRLLKLNDYYANVEPADPGTINSEAALAYTFGPFGAPPRARITLAQVGSTIVRIQLVPNGAVPEAPVEIVANLTNMQIACLEQGNCVSVAVPEELTAYLNPPAATPEASPPPSP
ncbi:hypothetical protein BH20CHL4_BH20CHL4_03720 [soil metagenome]